GFTRWTVIARALTGAVRTGKYWTAMESDIVTLLRGSSSGCRTLEAEATLLEGVAPVWRESGNVVYRTFSAFSRANCGSPRDTLCVPAFLSCARSRSAPAPLQSHRST